MGDSASGLELKRHYDRIHSWQDLQDFKKADLAAYNLSKWHPGYRLAYPGLYYQRILRDVEYLYGRGWVKLGRIRHVYLKYISIVTGISIPPGVFGRGLSIPHIGSIVVNDKAEFGAFCRIHSATNIGENKGGAPSGGDGIYIGPGAVLYGAINLGSSVVVGANSVLNNDVEAGLVVAGAPAKIVSEVGTEGTMPSWILAALTSYKSRAGD